MRVRRCAVKLMNLTLSPSRSHDHPGPATLGFRRIFCALLNHFPELCLRRFLCDVVPVVSNQEQFREDFTPMAFAFAGCFAV